jgi:predicted amidohydrolase YtcJ
MALTKQKKTALARSPSEQQGKADREGKEAEGGILLEKEDIQLIYKALRSYSPTDKEAQLHDILVESFEELLAIEYIELQLGEG